MYTASFTISAKKLFIAIPEGRVPNDSKTAKVHDWPKCQNLSDIHTFLSLSSYMRIWIKDYSTITWPLIDLTYKGPPFIWQEEHKWAIQMLKDEITQSPALVLINYSTDHTVYISVDLSICGVGCILA